MRFGEFGVNRAERSLGLALYVYVNYILSPGVPTD